MGHMPRGPGRIFKAAKWSWQGLRAAWLLITLLLMGVPTILIGLIPSYEQIGYWAAVLLVLAMELANSAIEAVIERYGPEYHVLAGRAKDMGSAAVFVLMMNVLLCWGLILVPRLL